MCCGETTLLSGSWVLIKAPVQIDCVNLSKLLPIPDAVFHLPGMRVLNTVSRVCSNAQMLGSKELYLRCD